MPVTINGSTLHTIRECAVEKGVSYDAMQAYIRRHRDTINAVFVSKTVLVKLDDLKNYRTRTPRRD